MCARRVDRPARHICSDCLMRLPFVSATGACSVCGREIPAFTGEFLCEDCQLNPPQFDRAAAALRFEGEARQMILDFKFNRHLWLRDDFVDFLEAALRARFDPASVDVVLPMPTSFFHRLDRGYNQCAYLADALAQRIDRRYDGRTLRRRGNPRRQSGLSEEDRRENAKGSFAVVCPEWVRGRTVLVVDDIMTTGATLSECARALKSAGAARVWCVTLARAIRG